MARRSEPRPRTVRRLREAERLLFAGLKQLDKAGSEQDATQEDRVTAARSAETITEVIEGISARIGETA